MTRISRTLAAVGAVALMIVSSAAEAIQAKVGDYDFLYLTSGDARVKPAQVFDNGKETWFEFRPLQSTPAIFGEINGRTEVLIPTADGPYMKVGVVSGKFTFAFDKLQATAVYGGVGRGDAPEIMAVTKSGMASTYKGQYPVDPDVKLISNLVVQPSVPAVDIQTNSYATPTKGDRVAWTQSEAEVVDLPIYFAKGSAVLSNQGRKALELILDRSKSASSILVVGRDDDSHKDLLGEQRTSALKAALIEAGVDESRIKTLTGQMAEPVGKLWPSNIRLEYEVQKPMVHPEEVAAKQPDAPADGFTFKAADQRVSNTVRRWSAAMNYQVIWDAPADLDAPVTGPGLIYAASMKEALSKLMVGLKKSGYDLQITIYSNRVIRFTGGSK